MDDTGILMVLPPGKRLHNYGKSACLMGKLTVSMVMFNSYAKLPEGISDLPAKSLINTAA